MCGIAGIMNLGVDAEAKIKKMMAQLYHRGPDSGGYKLFENDDLVLGHRRLAILDLSESGSQPMTSADGRYTIVLNGEIYNYLELMEKLQEVGVTSFRGTSDTEVLVECFAAFGIPTTCDMINGMYAIGLYDREKKELTLIRDRGGEKPLYYGKIGNSIYFASELKAIKAACNRQNLKINEEAIQMFLQYRYIPQPLSIYENIYKLKQGCYITFKYPTWKSGEEIRYWKYGERLEQYEGMSYGEAKDEFKKLLTSAIKRQMKTDVPYGAFLSGGIDSSLVTAVMQDISDEPIHTFTIGFENRAFNEAEYAKKIAKYLGCNHTERYFSSKELLDIVPKMTEVYDEPFADVSQLPMYLLSQTARKKVTVCLSGDCGDELFAGYGYYVSLPEMLQWSKAKCGTIGLMMKAASFLEPRFYERGERIARLHNAEFIINHDASIYIEKFVNLLYEKDYWYEHLISDFPLVERLEATDFYRFMTDSVLTKVDRAAMANSLETRVPLLDRQVMEFSTSIPLTYKIADGKQKRIMQDLLGEYLPKDMYERPKSGFGVPIHDFLRGGLREWADDLIYGGELKSISFIDYKKMYKEWEYWKTKTYRTRMLEWWSICVLADWIRKEQGL